MRRPRFATPATSLQWTPGCRSAIGLQAERLDGAAIGAVIGAGRASEIVDLGDGRVLRRFKDGGRPEREAAIMEHARAYGFAVPHVLEVLSDGLVLERVDGPTMLAALRRGPWRAARSHGC